MTSHRPFDGLDPETVLAAVESFGRPADGHLLALNSYENRVYQVGVEDAPPVVVKFYRPERWSLAAILEEHSFAFELESHELPVVAPCKDPDGQSLREQGGFKVAMYERRSGSWPELVDAQRRRWMGRLLGRIHAIGAIVDFQHRPALDVHTFGEEPSRFLLDSGLLPAGYIGRYAAASSQLVACVSAAFDAVAPVRLIRTHGDCHGGNILWGRDGPAFVDLDDSRMAPAVQDLWMFLNGSSDERRGQLLDLLEGYEDFAHFNHSELRLVEALRGLRLIHYSAWLARRWDDPAFPAAFPWFGTEGYWAEHIQDLEDQVTALGEVDDRPEWAAH